MDFDSSKVDARANVVGLSFKKDGEIQAVFTVDGGWEQIYKISESTTNTILRVKASNPRVHSDRPDAMQQLDKLVNQLVLEPQHEEAPAKASVEEKAEGVEISFDLDDGSHICIASTKQFTVTTDGSKYFTTLDPKESVVLKVGPQTLYLLQYTARTGWLTMPEGLLGRHDLSKVHEIISGVKCTWGSPSASLKDLTDFGMLAADTSYLLDTTLYGAIFCTDRGMVRGPYLDRFGLKENAPVLRAWVNSKEEWQVSGQGLGGSHLKDVPVKHLFTMLNTDYLLHSSDSASLESLQSQVRSLLREKCPLRYEMSEKYGVPKNFDFDGSILYQHDGCPYGWVIKQGAIQLWGPSGLFSPLDFYEFFEQVFDSKVDGVIEWQDTHGERSTGDFYATVKQAISMFPAALREHGELLFALRDEGVDISKDYLFRRDFSYLKTMLETVKKEKEVTAQAVKAAEDAAQLLAEDETEPVQVTPTKSEIQNLASTVQAIAAGVAQKPVQVTPEDGLKAFFKSKFGWTAGSDDILVYSDDAEHGWLVREDGDAFLLEGGRRFQSASHSVLFRELLESDDNAIEYGDRRNEGDWYDNARALLARIENGHGKFQKLLDLYWEHDVDVLKEGLMQASEAEIDLRLHRAKLKEKFADYASFENVSDGSTIFVLNEDEDVFEVLPGGQVFTRAKGASYANSASYLTYRLITQDGTCYRLDSVESDQKANLAHLITLFPEGDQRQREDREMVRLAVKLRELVPDVDARKNLKSFGTLTRGPFLEALREVVKEKEEEAAMKGYEYLPEGVLEKLRAAGIRPLRSDELVPEDGSVYGWEYTDKKALLSVIEKPQYWWRPYVGAGHRPNSLFFRHKPIAASNKESVPSGEPVANSVADATSESVSDYQKATDLLIEKNSFFLKEEDAICFVAKSGAYSGVRQGGSITSSGFNYDGIRAWLAEDDVYLIKLSDPSASSEKLIEEAIVRRQRPYGVDNEIEQAHKLRGLLPPDERRRVAKEDIDTWKHVLENAETYQKAVERITKKFGYDYTKDYPNDIIIVAEDGRYSRIVPDGAIRSSDADYAGLRAMVRGEDVYVIDPTNRSASFEDNIAKAIEFRKQGSDYYAYNRVEHAYKLRNLLPEDQRAEVAAEDVDRWPAIVAELEAAGTKTAQTKVENTTVTGQPATLTMASGHGLENGAKVNVWIPSSETMDSDTYGTYIVSSNTTLIKENDMEPETTKNESLFSSIMVGASTSIGLELAIKTATRKMARLSIAYDMPGLAEFFLSEEGRDVTRVVTPAILLGFATALANSENEDVARIAESCIDPLTQAVTMGLGKVGTTVITKILFDEEDEMAELKRQIAAKKAALAVVDANTPQLQPVKSL